MQQVYKASAVSSSALKVNDLCVGDRPVQLTDRTFQSQLLRLLDVDQRSTVEELKGCGGAHNQGVCILKSPQEDLVLKLVKSQAVYPGVPTEAENLIKISREHPALVHDMSVAFPRQIIRLLGSRQNHRYDVIVMEKAPGRGLGQVIQQKWRAGRVPELLAILEKAGKCLAEFHQHYGGKQHGDLTPTNVLYDEASGRVTLIDLGGMGSSSSENDVSYFSKSLSLSARLMDRQLEIQGVQHFKQGYAKVSGNSGSVTAEHPLHVTTFPAHSLKAIPAPATVRQIVMPRSVNAYPTLLMTPKRC